ncbi:hypothetical protein DFH06DRAFT_1292987 [Mycena polygramma]|nr:hypothetical protein DFH06DRAFT_1292987 [Mycena polygramma]
MFRYEHLHVLPPVPHPCSIIEPNLNGHTQTQRSRILAVLRPAPIYCRSQDGTQVGGERGSDLYDPCIFLPFSPIRLPRSPFVVLIMLGSVGWHLEPAPRVRIEDGQDTHEERLSKINNPLALELDGVHESYRNKRVMLDMLRTHRRSTKRSGAAGRTINTPSRAQELPRRRGDNLVPYMQWMQGLAREVEGSDRLQGEHARGAQRNGGLEQNPPVRRTLEDMPIAAYSFVRMHLKTRNNALRARDRAGIPQCAAVVSIQQHGQDMVTHSENKSPSYGFR